MKQMNLTPGVIDDIMPHTNPNPLPAGPVFVYLDSAICEGSATRAD